MQLSEILYVFVSLLLERVAFLPLPEEKQLASKAKPNSCYT
jgi:hypothetical protein